ncbi:MAG: DNA-binding protein [Lachnospiraceae bacterium]|nr:DNA-binding protein [Lachnospiraceae bacterium]
MEKVVEQTLLYDFYGELLTEHQKAIYEEAVFEDMSYSEIAQEHGISRQGVFDLIKRCDAILGGYEEKLRLVDKFLKMKKSVDVMRSIAESIKTEDNEEQVRELISIADGILEDE